MFAVILVTLVLSVFLLTKAYFWAKAYLSFGDLVIKHISNGQTAMSIDLDEALEDLEGRKYVLIKVVHKTAE